MQDKLIYNLFQSSRYFSVKKNKTNIEEKIGEVVFKLLLFLATISTESLDWVAQVSAATSGVYTPPEHSCCSAWWVHLRGGSGSGGTSG